jgi:hypothetical protein
MWAFFDFTMVVSMIATLIFLVTRVYEMLTGTCSK